MLRNLDRYSNFETILRLPWLTVNFSIQYYCYSPEVGEPLDQLRCVVLIEPDVGEVHLENGRGRVPDPEEHQLRLPQMYRC